MNSHRTRVSLLALALVTALAACAGTPESDSGMDTAGATPEATSGPEATADATRTPATPTDAGQTFADLDSNKDGRLTQDELAANEMLREHFSAADKDGDGALSPSEVEAHRTEMSGRP